VKQKLNCILLIDDDEATNFLNKMLIESVCCTKHIEVAQSGMAAIAYLFHPLNKTYMSSNSGLPDLMFLDINMPAMNGWEFLEQFNKLHAGNKRKIITVMLTTSINPDDNQKANEIPHISAYETKPLNAEKLNAILVKYFPQQFELIDN
jgi:CheY-like chemotaxis protein